MTPEKLQDLAAYGVIGSARFLLSILKDENLKEHERMAVKCLREDLQSFDLAKYRAEPEEKTNVR